ncbi:hypothetical protein MKS83_10375 [Chryseobacterium sp. Y16C]|uniref:hypothetical protein n=1 Tax=Chryseobacterium sp. Y16C TaxID=2920939 RepID=UPI001F0C59BD|nr:hypothetical protein [Chryseobacterium sp. Y16C]UMQ44090.1 hypothetical protein MKS83_10375 [Chryseobacterium sp. Y16C]
MNNQLLLILFWILASCGRPVSSVYQEKNISVISAEKTEWVGGRAGVRGIMYTVKLKKKNNQVIAVKTLHAEGNTISFVQSNSEGIIVIRGNLQLNNTEDNAFADKITTEKSTSPTLNPKDNWIEYIVKDSKKLYKINISKFILIEPVGELIPKRQ